MPWWCKSTEEIPVTTGPAVGTVDWYAGTHKSPLPWDDCVAMSAMFDVAKNYAEQWKTEGAAEGDGWKDVTRTSTAWARITSGAASRPRC